MAKKKSSKKKKNNSKKQKSNEKKKSSNEPITLSPSTKYILWTIGAGLLLFFAASLISYSPQDAQLLATSNPIDYKYNIDSHPDAYHNWMGPSGAKIAHNIYKFFGLGAWVPLLGVLSLLIAGLLKRSVNQLILRSIGLCLMAAAVSGFVTLASDGQNAWPGGGYGGIIGQMLNGMFVNRFGTPGGTLIFFISFWIGGLLAADQAVIWFMRHISNTILKLKHLNAPSKAIAGKLSSISLNHKASATATNKSNPRSKKSQKQEQSDKNYIPEDAGGLGGTIAFDPNNPASMAEEEWEYVDEDGNPIDPNDPDYEEVDQYEEEYEDEEQDPAVANAVEAYTKEKAYNPDSLREKMKKLTINFAPKVSQQKQLPQDLDVTGYKFPELDILEEPESNFTKEMEALIQEQAVQLEEALQTYRIKGSVVGIDSGPVITLFEIRLAPGTKVSTLNRISSDLARALKVQNIRIVPNMQGKDTVGIEVPNLKKEKVRLKELMLAAQENTKKMKLPMFLGKDASGTPLISDLSAMPHMLIAGTTGSGKSVCMNTIIMSFLYTKKPDELKLILVDPKMVEMSMFRDIPHLMCPVVTEMGKAASILEWAVTKMDERYELLAEVGVRDLSSYNKLGWDEIKERMNPATPAEEARIPKKLPFIVFVIDELADLMMTNKEVEDHIVRIAQKARAVGIHLILATQRPQANVVTGLIKSNMPCRISFKVASGMDSRIVLDQKGAELLLGHGDMMYISPRSADIVRAQGTLVDDHEIRNSVKFLKTISKQSFEPSLVQIKNESFEAENAERDPLFDKAVRIVLETKRGSVSLLQRRLTIGYSRASRLIEEMAQAGLLGDYKGSQAREVTMSVEEYDAIMDQARKDAAEGYQADQADDPNQEEGQNPVAIMQQADPDNSLEAFDNRTTTKQNIDTIPDEFSDEYKM